MAIAFVEVATTNPTGIAQSVDANIPAHSPGDLLLASVVQNRANTFNGAPAGWALLDTMQDTALTHVVLYRIADGTEGATVTFAFTGTNAQNLVVMAAYSGVDTSAPIIDHAGTFQTSGSSQTLATPAVTNTDAAAMAVAAFAARQVAATGSFTTPANMTERADIECGLLTTAETATALDDRTNAPTGAQTYSADYVGASAQNTRWLGFLKPASGGVAPATGSASGSLTLSGSTTGATEHAGAIAGSLTLNGAATGSAPVVAGASGSASGALVLTGSAIGATVREGSATGSLALTGHADGSTAHQGGSQGGLTLSGQVTGTTPHRGSASGSMALSGFATGNAPTVGGSSGSATGVLTLSGSATGRATHAGSASGAITLTLAASGSTVHSGTAGGSLTLAGSATGVSTTERRDLTIISVGPPQSAWQTTAPDKPIRTAGAPSSGWSDSEPVSGWQTTEPDKRTLTTTAAALGAWTANKPDSNWSVTPPRL